ncbi:MAG: sugar phosphate isomerase/epimerase [candidate division Zixibacteria bacterium]|nr:sugar phosphate isomerase/epimerase [candidate division Zixibacteria bacterium]
MFMNLNAGAIGIRATLSEALEMAQAHGFGGVDFSIVEAFNMAKTASPDDVKDLLIRTGCTFGGWGVPVNFRGDEQKWKEEIGWLRQYAAFAQKLGAERALTGVMPFSDDLPWEENYALHVKRMKPAVEILQDHGCRLGIEFIGPKTLRTGKKYEFIYNMADMLGLCADLGPNAGLLLDLWHWYTSHSTEEQLRSLTNGQVVAVHVNDAPVGIPVDEQLDLVRCLPGETGVLDIDWFIGVLAGIGYDGPVTPEPFSKRVNAMAPQDALRATADSLKKWM